jgi:hypothetical protein
LNSPKSQLARKNTTTTTQQERDEGINKNLEDLSG